MSPLSRWISLGWIGVGAFGVAVLIILGLGLRSQRDAEQWVGHTLQVESALLSLDSDVNGMAGEIRGYLLGRQKSWLDTYRGEADEAWQEVARIQQMTGDNPVQVRNALVLRGALQHEVDWGDRLAVLIQAGNTAESMQLVAHGQGESQLEQLRGIIRSMFGEEQRLLQLRQTRTSHLRRVGVSLAILAAILMAAQSLITLGFLRARFRGYEREQRLLRQAQDYAEAIVATVRQPLLVIDQEMRVVSANRSFYLWFGLSQRETEGVALAQLGGGHWNIPELFARLHHVFADEQEMENFALEHEFPRLGRRHLLLSARKVFRPGNHTGLLLLAIEDDTERARSEEQLRQINAELEGFAYMVAHDLRAPLRGMQGFAEALVEDYRDKLDDTGIKYAEHIGSSARRMDDLIRDLLDYSRLSRTEVQLSEVPLCQAVAAARQQTEANLAQKGGELIVEEPLPTVQAHFAILVQIIANLLDNGAKFVAPGVAPKLRIRAERRARRHRLWIEDNGIGIAEQFQQRIFRVFERLHGQETYPGTGIGLAIVRKGAERMGAEVGVESAPGEGARFWIDFPGDNP